MARIIPPEIDREANVPPGEAKLFRDLKADPETESWIVLHSLDVAEHNKRIAGEVDFVIIVPELGVLCLEVKSHGTIQCEEGQWYFGRQRKRGRSPFKQVSDTMHSLRERLADSCSGLRHIVFWSAVAFPFFTFTSSSPEWHSWQIIDKARLRSRESVGIIVKEILQKAREYLQQSPSARWFTASDNSPTSADCRRIARELRPNFEFYESPGSRSKRSQEEIKHYTDLQVGALDAISLNPRIAFVGPAGTGKTSLAIEAARRARAQGRRVLLTCFNRHLGSWLSNQACELSPEVSTGTFHQFLVKITGYRPDGNEPSYFWERQLPSMAVEFLLPKDSTEMFDALIVDEAQDLVKPHYLEIMDLVLDGGLRYGNWMLFGDFTNQRIYSSTTAAEMLDSELGQYASGFPFYQLGDNCRNTPRIGRFVEQSSRLTPGYRSFMRPDRLEDNDPGLRFYQTSSDQAELLVSALENLYLTGFRGEDIVVLSPKSAPSCTARQITVSPWKERLKSYEAAGTGYVRYSTIHAFKGLEAPAIVITDLEEVKGPEARDLFYVATSRAQDHLIILAHDSVRDKLVDIITQ